MPTFTFTTAAHIPLAAIVRAINLVYPNGNDTVEGYVAYSATTQIDLAHSVVALDDVGQVAGVAMLAVRDMRGWCGDAAVIPQYQNQKLGQELMRRFSDAGRSIGLKTLQLETRVTNLPARRVYEKEGYQYTRRMPCYSALVDALGWHDVELPINVNIARVPEASLAMELVRWHDPHFAPTPCWERELPTLLVQREQHAWLLTRNGRELAFLLCAAKRAETTLHVHHLALKTDANAEDVRALLIMALRDMSKDKIRVGLEPEDSRVAMCLWGFGFQVEKDLFEMVKKL
jgi:ribosomal protein S18 acetylase RimI-like enzyme